MSADPPDVAAVLRAIVPPPRKPGDGPDPECCPTCWAEWRAEEDRADWRALHDARAYADAERRRA